MGGNCCAGPRVAPPDSSQIESQTGRFTALSKDITELEQSAAALLKDIKSLAEQLHAQLEEIQELPSQTDLGNDAEKERERRAAVRRLEQAWEQIVDATKGNIVEYLGKTETIGSKAERLKTKVSKKQASKRRAESYKDQLVALSRSLDTSLRNVLAAQTLLSALPGPNQSFDTASAKTTLADFLGKDERGSLRLSLGNRRTATSLQDSAEVYFEEVHFGGTAEVDLGGTQEGKFRGQQQIVEMLDEIGHLSTSESMPAAYSLWSQQAEYQELTQSSLLRRLYSQYQPRSPRLFSRKEVTATFLTLASCKLASAQVPLDLFVLDFFLSPHPSSGLDSLLSFLEGLKASVAEHRAEAEIQAQVLGLFTNKPLPRTVANTVIQLIALAEKMMELETNHLEMALRRAQPVPISAQTAWMPLDCVFSLAYRVFTPDFVEEGSKLVESIKPGQVSSAEYARFCILFYLHSTHQDGNSFFQSLSKGERRATYPAFLSGLKDTLVSPQGARELFELMEDSEQEGISRPTFLNAFNLNRYHSTKELLAYRVPRQMLFDRLIKACMDSRRRTIGILGELYMREKSGKDGISADQMVALLDQTGSTISPEETVKRYLQAQPKAYLTLRDLVRIAETYGGLSPSLPFVALDGQVVASLEPSSPTPAVQSLLLRLKEGY